MILANISSSMLGKDIQIDTLKKGLKIGKYKIHINQMQLLDDDIHLVSSIFLP